MEKNKKLAYYSPILYNYATVKRKKKDLISGTLLWQWKRVE